MAQTVLVTGGAGYVGSTLVGFLLEKGYQVVVADKLSFGGESLLSYWHHPRFKFVLADLVKPEDTRRIFEEYAIDHVVHLAAIVGDPACAKQPQLAEEINWKASCLLFETAKKHGVEHFIFASTCSNYGKMSDPNGFVDENSTLSPVSLYAELKVKFEKFIAQSEKDNPKFSPTVLRFATVYGLSPRMRFDLTVNEFTKELALGRDLEIFGEQFWRPYCHVYDFARAIELILNSDLNKVRYNVFNVGDTGENYQKQMIVEEIKKFIPQASVRYVKKSEDPRDYRVTFEKINRELGFKISKTVPDGIEEIKRMLDTKVILNADDPKYKNI